MHVTVLVSRIQKIKKDIDDEKISIQKNVYKLMKDIY